MSSLDSSTIHFLSLYALITGSGGVLIAGLSTYLIKTIQTLTGGHSIIPPNYSEIAATLLPITKDLGILALISGFFFTGATLVALYKLPPDLRQVSVFSLLEASIFFSQAYILFTAHDIFGFDTFSNLMALQNTLGIFLLVGCGTAALSLLVHLMYLSTRPWGWIPEGVLLIPEIEENQL